LENFAQSVNNLKIYDSGAVTAAGLLTSVGVNAGTGTVRGASDGTTNAYIPPCYKVGGVTCTSGVHQAFGSCTDSTVGVTTCSITLTAPEAFTSNVTYACGMSYVASTTTTGSATGETIVNVSGTSVTGTVLGLAVATGTATLLFNCLGT
jgi:hypothetical protein